MQNEHDLEYQLHAYVDGDLDEDSMGDVEEYLRKNPEMAAKVRDYLRQKDDIRGFASKEVANDEAPALRGLARKLASRLKPRRQPRWRRPILVAVLLAGGWLGHALYAPLAEGPRFANEIVQAHLLSSSDPSEVLPISTERLSKLFSRIGEVQRVPDLGEFGYEAVGAQLLPSDEGPVLHIPYRAGNGAMVSYFLFHDPLEDEIPRHVLRRAGVTMVYWQHAHSRYAIAAPLPDDELTRIAAFLDAPLGTM